MYFIQVVVKCICNKEKVSVSLLYSLFISFFRFFFLPNSICTFLSASSPSTSLSCHFPVRFVILFISLKLKSWWLVYSNCVSSYYCNALLSTTPQTPPTARISGYSPSLVQPMKFEKIYLLF
jgi:hypothetical protein